MSRVAGRVLEEHHDLRSQRVLVRESRKVAGLVCGDGLQVAVGVGGVVLSGGQHPQGGGSVQLDVSVGDLAAVAVEGDDGLPERIRRVPAESEPARSCSVRPARPSPSATGRQTGT